MKRLSIVFACILICLALAASSQAAAIHQAAAKGDIGKIRAMLKKDPTLANAADKDGATPLHWAAAAGKAGAAEALIGAKADVNARKKDGVTPLHVAAALGKADVARVLLAHNANAAAVDNKGRTPLSLAEANGKTQVASLLTGKEAEQPAAAKAEPSPAPAAGAPEGDVEALARSIVSEISRKDFEAVVQRFDPTMKAAMDASGLRNAWDSVTSQAGAFQQQLSAKKANVRGYDVVTITCKFQKTLMNAQISFNSSKQVSGLYFVPAEK